MANPKQLLQDITGGKFKPVYYFFGSEDYRISEAVKFVSHKFLPDEQFITNFRKIDGKKTKTGDILTELAMIPMLGEKQVFVITDFQSFRPKEIEKILKILKPVDPNRMVMFTSPSSKTPRKSSAFIKTMNKEAVVVEFNKLSVNETFVQIQGKLKRENINISGDAIKYLAELLAGNRGAIETEIAKLIDYIGKDGSIEIDDVKKLVNGFEVFTVFEMADFVVARNTTKVLQMLKSLIADGNNPVVLTSLLQQHFSSLYLVKNGKLPIGNRSFLVYKFKPQAATYSNQQLENIIIKIAEADANLRRTGMPAVMTLEVLAIGLTGVQN